MLTTTREFRRTVAERTAPVMFWLALLFLAIAATLIVLWVDIPLLSQHGEGSDETAPSSIDGPPDEPPAAESPLDPDTLAVAIALVYVLEFLWAVFLLEFLLRFLIRDRQTPFWPHGACAFIWCLCPPLRLCWPNHDMDGKVWLPVLGWRKIDDDLRQQLDRIFSVPMIVIALMILPVLLVEFGMKDQTAAHRWLRIVLHVGTSLIWFAFAVEFIVMVSVAERKFRYCRQHWLDLAIILLPLISFLRMLRVVRATRVARLARLQQLTKMGRLYRLRGLTTRALRALLLLDLLHRLLFVKPERRLRQLRELLREKEAEAAMLRRKIEQVEAETARRRQDSLPCSQPRTNRE